MKSTCIREIRMFSMLIMTALSGLVFAIPASAADYTAFDIGTLGGPGTYATALNATGQVTGNSDTAGGGDNAFITKANGVGISDLGTFSGGNKSLGFGINASGQVVREATSALLGSIVTHAFITGPNGSNMSAITGWDYSHAYGINDAGQVVGNINDMLFYTGTGAFVTGPNGSGAVDLSGMNAMLFT